MMSATVIVLVCILHFSTVAVAGTVDHKTIVGIRDGTQYTLLSITPHGMIVKDPALLDLIDANDSDLTVDEELEWELLSCGYSEIRYLVSIRVSTEDTVNDIEPGGTMAYFADRGAFNALGMGESANVEISRSEFATISRVDG